MKYVSHKDIRILPYRLNRYIFHLIMQSIFRLSKVILLVQNVKYLSNWSDEHHAHADLNALIQLLSQYLIFIGRSVGESLVAFNRNSFGFFPN